VQGMCVGDTSRRRVWLVLYIVCSIKHVRYIIYYEFYLGVCAEIFDEDHSTVYLISRIRCNNIHIRLLLHLILKIRYVVPYPWT